MESVFELRTVYVSNIFGIVLVAVLLAGNIWRFREKGTENAFLQLILFFAFCGCILDPIAYTADGHPGPLARIVVYGSNALLYLTDMFGTFFWLLFLAEHLNARFSMIHRYILGAALITGTVMVILNNFVPFIFDVSFSNTYERKIGYWFYMFIDYGFLVDSLVLYFVCKHKGGLFKAFPVWVYFLPLITGTVIQSLFYGISAISASTAVSIAGVFATLQSERVYRDKLTGVFNYTYLDHLNREYAKKKDLQVTGILIDINSFQSVNLNYGHATGNKVLVKMAKILNRSIGELGLIIRYSGDQFIAFINTQNEMAISMCITRIRSGLSEANNFNSSYKLSVSICTQSYDTNKTMNDFIDSISRSMMEVKKDSQERASTLHHSPLTRS